MPSRRFFLHALGGGVLSAAPGFGRTWLAGGVAPQRATVEPWLQGLVGKHRQFFDVGTIADGHPLSRVGNFLSAYSTAYGLADRDIIAIFGAHSSALAFVLDDAAWSRFGLGAMYGVRTHDGVLATTNVFKGDKTGSRSAAVVRVPSVYDLMSRGVRFWACHNSVMALSERLATSGHGSDDAIRHELLNALLPGVLVVPAMLVAANRAQEIGITYAFVS